MKKENFPTNLIDTAIIEWKHSFKRKTSAKKQNYGYVE